MKSTCASHWPTTFTLAYNLRNAGYDVALAASGPQALLVFGPSAPDLVLRDVMLPEFVAVPVGEPAATTDILRVRGSRTTIAQAQTCRGVIVAAAGTLAAVAADRPRLLTAWRTNTLLLELRRLAGGDLNGRDRT